MSIQHCGRKRKSRAYWLNPNASERKLYKWIVVEVLDQCPGCKQSVMEWHGINLQRVRTPKHRIQHKHQEDWRIRLRVDINEEMDTSQWESMPTAVYWVEGSMARWPFIKVRKRVE